MTEKGKEVLFYDRITVLMKMIVLQFYVKHDSQFHAALTLFSPMVSRYVFVSGEFDIIIV